MRIAHATPWEGPDETPEADGSVPRTAVLDAVEDTDREYLLQYLLLNKHMVTRADVAEEIAARSQDVDRESVDAEARKGAELRLHHDHLPSLEEAGIVDYDQRSEMVALRPAAEAAVKAAL